MHHLVKLVLVLSALFAVQQTVANPPARIAPRREGNDSIRALLKYLWPVLSSAKRPGRVYYRAICMSDDHSYPLKFPEIDVRTPLKAGTDVAVVRSIFRRDRDVTVTEDRTGILRVTIGEVPETVLHTSIPKLSLDALSQYNVVPAMQAIQQAPEVQSVMAALSINVPVRPESIHLTRPAKGLPHLPAEILNVTMDQALDMVARTWRGIVFYGACSRPDTYELFFTHGVYFQGAKF